MVSAIPTAILIGFSHPTARNFGFGQSSQSHLRLRCRPRNSRVPCAPRRLRGSAQGTSVSLARTREIRLASVPAYPSPPAALGSAKGANKTAKKLHASLGLSKGIEKAKLLPPPEWGRAGERVFASAKDANLRNPTTNNGLRITEFDKRLATK